jgi:hypothetical protein
MSISVSLLVDKSRKGVLVTGSYADVIDLSLFKLTSFHSKDGKTNVDRLSLSFDTRDGIKFGVSNGLTLLDKPSFYLAVDYKPNKAENKREFSGKASFDGELLGGFLQDPSVEFAYRRGRWSMSNLKLRRDATWDSKSPTGGLQFDLKKALQMGFKSDSGCKELVGFVLDQLLEMKFTFSLGLPDMKQSDMKSVTSSQGSPEAEPRPTIIPTLVATRIGRASSLLSHRPST